jgi:uncharacterized protein with HEPN domain
MSDRDETLYIEDMLEFCGRAITYAADLSEQTLTQEPMRYDAILRNVELIGEAVTHVPATLRCARWRPMCLGARSSARASGWLTATWVSGPPRCGAS